MSKLTLAGSVKGLQTRSFCHAGADEHTWALEVSVTSFHLDFESPSKVKQCSTTGCVLNSGLARDGFSHGTGI